jgi:thiol-disulfide isomerase/thioredoxin
MRAVALTSALVLTALGGCAAGVAREKPSALVGTPLKLAVLDLEGRAADLLAGSPRAVVVHFWATWCEPCLVAMPEVDALARDYAPRGVRVVGVSIDAERADIDGFLAARPVSFSILWDRSGEALGHTDASIMPVSFILDGRGVVRHVLQGWAKGSLAHERALLDELLAGR